MKFLICNIHIGSSSILESNIEQLVLKEMAFNSKIVSRLPGGEKNISYYFILIPFLDLPPNYTDKMLLLRDKFYYKIRTSDTTALLDEAKLYSVIKIFEKLDDVMNLEKMDISVDIIADTNKYSITYTDGSFKKSTKEASYGIVKLLEESKNGLNEPYTKGNFKYKTMSAKIPNGTNNIGELYGLKTAIDNFDDNKYQIIISDSEYSVKCLREWYYTWKDNNFKNYAKKTIANKDLVISIFDNIKKMNDNHLIFFKWTKGHDKNPFNELCDELAKKALK